MIFVRAGSGWQTVLADLSLILFMVTAAALSQAGADSGAPVSPVSQRSEPVAWYTPQPGAPAIGDWLASQSADERQQLTIVAQYWEGDQAEALREAGELAVAAGRAGVKARIVAEPGPGGVFASLAFDDPQASLARGLQSVEANQTSERDDR